MYDASTFTQNPDGTYNDDYTRSPEARYWIPTAGEWLKAVYYDRDRYGPGHGGWWNQPAGSDEPLQIGYPNEGGQTNGGLWEWYDSYLPAGMYPRVQTPWGSLDASGGVSEHNSDGFLFGSSFLDQPGFVPSSDTAGSWTYRTTDHPNRGYLGGLRLVRPLE